MGAMPQGLSPAAKFLDNTRRQALKRFRDSATFSKQPAYDGLAEVCEERRTANWDAHGAEPVEADTLRNAYCFIEALPLGYPLPCIGAEPDGHLTLEWYRATNWLLSVSVSPEGVLYYAALLEDDDPRGSCRFDGEVPETILYWIRRVCAHDGPEPHTAGRRR
jgi:hypothetical protein